MPTDDDDSRMPPADEEARPALDDTAAWPALAPLLRPYLPWTTGAMRPAGLVMVLNDVWFRTPALVVELGSGVSTVVLARLLRELAGASWWRSSTTTRGRRGYSGSSTGRT